MSATDEKAADAGSINVDALKSDVHVKTEEAQHEVGWDLYLQSGDLEYTQEESNEVRRKIDMWIMPAFCITQGLAFMDKTALNWGNLWGMKKSLGITTAQYSWFASAFYLGYLVSAWPSNILLQKYPTGRVMGLTCFFWGIIVSCTAACHNFAGGLVNRTLLGILEAMVTPGLGLMTPMWWTLREQPVRHLTWYCFNGVAGIFGSLIAYGLGHSTSTKVPSWALIFIVYGVITSLWGIYLLIFLPDSPASARFLNETQKVIAVKRVAENRVGTKNTKVKWEQVLEAFMDPKLYALFLASIAAQIPNGVVSNFSSTIIKGFGFTTFETTLLDIPGQAMQILSLVISGYLASRFKNCRAIVMFVGNTACIIAASCLTYAPKSQKWGRLVAFWFTSFQSIGFALSLVMVSANIGGYTKRQTVAAVTFIGYCVGNIVGPHVLIETEKAAGYPTATKAMLAGYVAKTGLHVMLGLYMWYWNKRWGREAATRGEVMDESERARRAEDIGMTDATEWHNPYFRYVL